MPAEEWIPLQEFLGDQVVVPEELDGVEVRGDVTTSQTRRLIESAIDTYESSRTFYRQAAEEAGELDLREPEEGETVAVLVVRPARQHRHGRGRPRRRRPGRRDRGARRR